MRRGFLSSLIIFILLNSGIILSDTKALSTPVIGSTFITLNPIADAEVRPDNPDMNYGQEKCLDIDIGENQTLSYIMFSFNDLNSSIPSDATIISATLVLDVTSGSWYTAGGHATVGVHYCQDNSWNELGITWNNKPVFETKPTDTVGFGMFSFTGTREWNATEDVRKALSSRRLTEVVKFETMGDYGTMSLGSREGPKPALEVEFAAKPLFSLHVESIQDTGATSNLGAITIAGFPLSCPNNASIVAGTYNATYESGYGFVRWETNGGMSITDPYSPTTKITASGPGVLRAVGNADMIQYFYDDGKASTIYSHSGEAGNMAAVRFTPLFSGKLKTIRIFIAHFPEAFIVHVLDADRTDLINPIAVTPTSTLWFDINMAGYNVNTIGGNDFYIAVEWINDHTRWSLGIDESKPEDSRSWTWNGTNWEPYTYNDYVIRTVVTSSMPFKAISHISCSLSSDYTDIGRNVKVSGTITPAHSGAAVVLRYIRPDQSIVRRTTTTTEAGQYEDVYAPDKLGNWTVRASWTGDQNNDGAISQDISLDVIERAQSSITDFSVSPKNVKEGDTIQVAGTLEPFPVYEPVNITLSYERPDGSHYTENVTTYPTVGDFTSTYKPNMTGSWSLTASFPGNRERTPTTSLTINFRVEEKTFLEKYGPLLLFLMAVIMIVAAFLARRRKSISRIR
jgi:hypothetical protein